MRREEIKVVMLDLGNVIICFDHMISARKIARYSNRGAQDIYNLFFFSDLTQKFDCGEIDEEEFFWEVKKMLDLKQLDKESFFQIWNDIFWENPGIAELIDEIRDRYEKFLIISNVNRPHFEYIWNKFPVVRLADEIILSYQVGSLKPEPKIYQLAVEKAGCSPERIFYVDDRKELVEAGAKFGLQAHLFCSLEEIRDKIL